MTLENESKFISTVDRRRFLEKSGFGLAGIALQFLMTRENVQAAPDVEAINHFPPKISRVVFIAMMGGASQLDLFDYKPKLREWEGRPLPASITDGRRFANISADAEVLGSPWKFQKHGESGIWCSSLLTHFPKIVDDICMLHAVQSGEINHPSGQLLMTTGANRVGRPSMGAWVQYGLGAESEELPAFVVLQSGEGVECGDDCFGNGFLPSENRGVVLDTGDAPLLFLSNPPGMNRKVRHETLKAIQKLNHERYEAAADPEILTRIRQYEMAFQLQGSVPEVCNLASETKKTLEMYGAKVGKSSFASNCLQARRLLEHGVRFVQLNHGGWDHHTDIKKELPKLCLETDQAVAALVTDLKDRGLLDETLVVWATEFGRTPMKEAKLGRDHHKTFSIWMTGGGIRRGHVHGETDELGYHPISGQLDFHDLHATILHLLGIDHSRFTFPFKGRRFRLTDVSGNVLNDIMT